MKSDKKQSNYLQAGYILRVCLITIAIGVGLLNSPSLSDSFPEGIVIFDYQVSNDTITFILNSDSTIYDFFLSEHIPGWFRVQFPAVT